ncbi:MAG: DUF1365 domain-containing protein [Oligoflexia bacterium]|nr:DUF1365 domain-containing protein [Oligoflexia bacterium]
MTSAIYRGSVWHKRTRPREHEFLYPAFVFALELDQLAQLNKLFPLFGFNRRAIFSLKDSDYLPHLSGDIGARVWAALQIENPDIVRPTRIVLITVPRYFGYVFNPVSFFICFNDTGNINAVVIEVHNTFGETFVYSPVLADQTSSSFGPAKFEKQFYVSPFLSVNGEYCFHLRDLGTALHIQVDLFQDNNLKLATNLTGKSEPFSKSALLRLLFQFPLSALLTMTRIQWQALRLYFNKQLRLFNKPKTPTISPHAARPSLISKLRLWILSFGENSREQ